jgi:hypothetical protein
MEKARKRQGRELDEKMNRRGVEQLQGNYMEEKLRLYDRARELRGNWVGGAVSVHPFERLAVTVSYHRQRKSTKQGRAAAQTQSKLA